VYPDSGNVYSNSYVSVNCITFLSCFTPNDFFDVVKSVKSCEAQDRRNIDHGDFKERSG
jgi:hypothetical protein